MNVIQLQEGPHLLLATPSRPRYQPASLLDPPIASSWPPAAAPLGSRCSHLDLEDFALVSLEVGGFNQHTLVWPLSKSRVAE